MQTAQWPARHEHTGSGAAALAGRQRLTQFSAAGSLRSAEPPGQQRAVNCSAEELRERRARSTWTAMCFRISSCMASTDWDTHISVEAGQLLR